ncbi:transferase [Paenibacillus sp. LMG 31459]|uniref:Transferase n=1 Tax=Paenibacillus phytohabitans TaxID=2654978 RepID=A0ABX1YHD7_9BACL|nr:acetyltransferase [Paenibacillus phytohabitans]NOU79235.1 transferase [Paenibacillus phytohabitans]
MRKRLVIAGAGSFGREVWQWANHVVTENRSWDSVVFINDIDTSGKIIESQIDCPIISSIDEYMPQNNDVVVCAVGNPIDKSNIVKRLEKKNVTFTNIIHPTAIIGSGVQLGLGIVLCPYTVISVNAKLGDHVAVNICSTIGHDSKIGEGTIISSHCDVTGFCELDERVFLGSGARLLPNSKIGAFATVGAGCVVLNEVEPYKTVAGVPAKYI